MSTVRWRPVDGARHAMRKEQLHRELGTELAALCGKTIKLVRPKETDWFWDSCPDCWAAAKIINSAAARERTLHRGDSGEGWGAVPVVGQDECDSDDGADSRAHGADSRARW
ncbi:zinc finger protein [Saccharopolyspora sp. ASAGF58]|uniref:zinc finger protein n=1 Tax=Saccharopolyspora sp. ASAGF58 TaxID=2719023 RepID=UPI0014463B9A|nr:zinc finger protein [Saccharopolyspora sp. ASAGF58]